MRRWVTPPVVVPAVIVAAVICPCDLSGALVMRGAVVTIAAGSKFDLVLPLAASNMVVVCVGALRGTSSVAAACLRHIEGQESGCFGLAPKFAGSHGFRLKIACNPQPTSITKEECYDRRARCRKGRGGRRG